LHVADRGSDNYELFCLCRDLGTRFLFHTCVDRLASVGDHTIADEVADARVGGRHRNELQTRAGTLDIAALELRYRRVRVCPPIGKQYRYAPLTLTVLHAIESGTPQNRDPIEWKLVTDLPVTSRAEAIEMLDQYALRWRTETYHKILKSGSRAEHSKLRTAERLANFRALDLLLAWRIA
jgi:hypothetical protein